MFGYEMVFVHGANAGPWIWTPWPAFFTEAGWSVRTLTLPGHAPGDADPHDGLDDYVDALEDFVHTPEKTVIVAHSMGGWVTMKYMEKHRVAASVLVAPLPIEGLPGRARNALSGMAPLTMLRVTLFGSPLQMVREDWVRRICFRDDTDPVVVRRVWENMGLESGRACRQMSFMRFYRFTGLGIRKKRLARTQAGIPHLIVASESDFYFRPGDLEGTARVLHAEMLPLKNMPHCMVQEDKEFKLAERIKAWLANRVGEAAGAPPQRPFQRLDEEAKP
ncbi:MAG: alpha/beta hydrolase [Acidobacteriota bacterium]